MFDHNIAEDPYFKVRNKAKADVALALAASGAPLASDTAVTLPSGEVIERDGVFEWGAWCELADKAEVMDATMIPWFADLQNNLPELLPESMKPGPT